MKKFYHLVFIGSIIFLISNLLIGLNKPLWLDEVYSLNIIQVKSLWQLVSNLYNGADTNPPFYFILIYFILKLTGSIIYIRLFSVILSIAGIYFLFNLLKNIVRLESIIIIQLIISTSFFFAQYLIVEIRPYALFMFLSALFVYQYYILSVNEKNSIKTIFLFVATIICMLYTHYFALFYIIITLIFELFNKRRNYNVVISIFSGLFLYIPWMMAIHNQFTIVHHTIWQQKPTLLEVSKLPAFYFNGITTLSIFLIAILIVYKKWDSISFSIKKYHLFIFLIISFAFFPYINIALTYLNLSVHEPRYYIISYVSFIILIGIIINLLVSYDNKLILSSFIAIIFLVGFIKIFAYYKYQKSKEEEIDKLLELNKSGIPILCESPHEFYPLDFYAKKMVKSSFYFILDKNSSELKGNIKNSIFDYYQNIALKNFYSLNHLIKIDTVLKNFQTFYIVNEPNRMIFENRFLNNHSYYVQKKIDNVYLIKKIKE